MDFLKSDTFRRIIAGLVGLALPVLNQKLNLNIPSEQVVAAIILAAGYIAQSAANTMHARSVAAGTAAVAAVTGVDPAIGLSEAPK
jgi:hypothetical protein